MYSCIYRGSVLHRRYEPVAHRFRFPLFMVYIDLSELDGLFQRKVLGRRPVSPLSLLRSDHLHDGDQSLDRAARDLVETKTGDRPTGPIRLLTQLRCWGYYFSPLNLFYCFSRDGGQIEAIIAEVNNMPWREQHHYVLHDSTQAGSRALRFSHQKDFHVSPFMEMNMNYHWRLSTPGRRLTARIENEIDGDKKFDASLSLVRRPLSRTQLAAQTLRFPLMTAQITCAIHWQALKLWWKQCPVYAHPGKLNPSERQPI